MASSSQRALASSAAHLKRFASSTTFYPLVSLYAIHRLQCPRSRQMSTKRKMQTSTAYSPASSSHLPLPVVGHTETVERSDGTHPNRTTTLPLRHDGSRSTSAPESSTRPVESPASVSPASVSPLPNTQITSEPSPPTLSPSMPRPRRYKLKPLKAAMTLTPSAVAQMRSLLAQPTPKLIRVGVRNKGCSGLAYHLEYVDAPSTHDELVDQDGVRVVIDSKALFSLIGSEMDWVEEQLSAKFVFRNPNIKEQCGCGESFMV